MTKEIKVNYGVEKVYNYLHDLRNLLKVINNLKVDFKNYHDAIIKVPVYGDIRIAVVNPLVPNKHIEAVAASVGTKIQVDLKEQDGGTLIKVNTECHPTGFFKTLVRGYIEEGLDKLPEFISKINFNE